MWSVSLNYTVMQKENSKLIKHVQTRPAQASKQNRARERCKTAAHYKWIRRQGQNTGQDQLPPISHRAHPHSVENSERTLKTLLATKNRSPFCPPLAALTTNRLCLLGLVDWLSTRGGTVFVPNTAVDRTHIPAIFVQCLKRVENCGHTFAKGYSDNAHTHRLTHMHARTQACITEHGCMQTQAESSAAVHPKAPSCRVHFVDIK